MDDGDMRKHYPSEYPVAGKEFLDHITEIFKLLHWGFVFIRLSINLKIKTYPMTVLFCFIIITLKKL